MPTTRIPPDEGTFAGYYREIETHDWYVGLSQETRDKLNHTYIEQDGWGMCNCGRGGRMLRIITFMEGSDAYSLSDQRCQRCTRTKTMEHTLSMSDFEYLYEKFADYNTSRLYDLLMPFEHMPEDDTTRDMCEGCNSLIFEENDLRVLPRQCVSVQAQDDDGEKYTVHANCSYTCECNAVMLIGGGTYSVDRNRVCYACYIRYDDAGEITECGWCNRMFTETHYSELRDRELCTNCFDSGWDCDDCGYTMYEDGEHECYRESDSLIYEYSYKPDPQFYGSDNYYFGFELEVEDERGWGCENGAELVLDTLGKRVYIKRDGSLDNGFEIVSHPHSFDEIKKLDLSFMNRLRMKGFRSWDTNTCGLHVHISRTAFRKQGKRDEAHELRFQKLIYDNGTQVRAIAGRTSAFARFNDKGALVPKVKFGHTADRYEAINSQNDHTLEVRVFRGSLKPTRVLSAVEFLHSAIEYTRNMKINPNDSQLGWIRFMGYVLDNKDKYENFAQIALSTLEYSNSREHESEEN
jgi:hypothetical protein